MKEAIIDIARFMAVSARTAPKSKGEDFVTIEVLEGDKVTEIGQAMVRWGEENGINGFIRDGRNVLASDAVVLVGIKDAEPLGLNCGACGFDLCTELLPENKSQFKGPQCAFRLVDLGIAVGSAVKTASILNVDNRIMYRIGMIARKREMINDDVVLGIPLSAHGKNVYFDRKEQ